MSKNGREQRVGFSQPMRFAGLAVVSLLVALLASAISPASSVDATPRDEILARAAAAKEQVDALDKQTELLSEDYNAARVRHQQLVEQEAEATLQLTKTVERTEEIQARLNSRALSMYRNGPVSFTEVLLDTSDFVSFAQVWDLLRRLNEADAQAVEELRIAKAEQAEAQRQLERRSEEAAAVSREIADRKQSIEAMLADRKDKLAGLEAEVAALDRAEEQRRAAEAARVSRQSARISNRTFPPPTKAARSEVVAIAKRYLGAPYVWGAEGPSSFDCSGFTMFVYRQVGVSLPRVSRDQIRAGQPVSRSDLQPGDLVFFGKPIHHVGIYVGQGLMIHSPRTGDVVKISPMHKDYVGATRP